MASRNVAHSRPRSRISSAWMDRAATAGCRTGVSLHSHTSASEESLTFIHKMFAFAPGLRTLFEHYEAKAGMCGFKLDFVRAHWRPPLQPRMAFDLEAAQIEQLGLYPLVSITDHDNIDAPMLLRTVPSARHIPVSLEWSVPFGPTEFHLGVHNLPSATGLEWQKRLAAYTATTAVGEARDRELSTLLHELDAQPGVLLVVNHPLWDLHKVGDAVHRREAMRFLELFGHTVHALELNALRDVRENRETVQMGRETGHVLISGGDRHALEPNANINLTDATSFREFVDEIRVDKRSHVFFCQQYARPWEQRILHSTLAAVTDYPHFMEGWQRWDERAFHPDRDGVMRPLSQLWADGRAPLPLRAAIGLVRMGRSRAFTRTFSLAFPGAPDPLAEMKLL